MILNTRTLSRIPAEGSLWWEHCGENTVLGSLRCEHCSGKTVVWNTVVGSLWREHWQRNTAMGSLQWDHCGVVLVVLFEGNNTLDLQAFQVCRVFQERPWFLLVPSETTWKSEWVNMTLHTDSSKKVHRILTLAPGAPVSPEGPVAPWKQKIRQYFT